MRLPRWRPALSGAIVAASTVAACGTVPYTGRSQLQFMSPQQESQLGVQAYQQTLAKARLSSDAAASGMVARVGSRIAAVTGHPEYQWEYRLIQDDKQANAFALPGGKVAVYTGILPITRDESGLAAVLGHEIGHVVALMAPGHIRIADRDHLLAFGDKHGLLACRDAGHTQQGKTAQAGVPVLQPQTRFRDLTLEITGTILSLRRRR